MQSTVTFLLFAFVIGAARAQTWAGSYTADSTCSTSTCCCLTGQVVLTSIGTSAYSVVSNVGGMCGNMTMFNGVAYVSGYTGWMVVTTNSTLTLSSDSRTINVISPSNTACNGRGVKSGAIQEYVNINMFLAAFLATVMMSFSKI